ncbi:hypothetical protein C7212DRAFT_235784 [Tuber magnatum]|uniref:PiggyBac transposable element-derived protein domain-containing protein n=1 Tax=Tuber magnatum TaxID=42249 RepID=A0A317SIK8_9PEZI|nr:hypothetical protein C7212DRAFT_235784 [Tuber magnatum]
MDNNIVRMLTTVHPWNEVTCSIRQKPQKTSTNAVLVQKAFGDHNRAAFFIPIAIDDYSYYMGGVDIADQCRAGFTTYQCALCNWLVFFYFFLDISSSNTHILINLTRTKQLNQLLNSGQLR